MQTLQSILSGRVKTATLHSLLSGRVKLAAGPFYPEPGELATLIGGGVGLLGGAGIGGLVGGGKGALIGGLGGGVAGAGLGYINREHINKWIFPKPKQRSTRELLDSWNLTDEEINWRARGELNLNLNDPEMNRLWNYLESPASSNESFLERARLWNMYNDSLAKEMDRIPRR